MSNRAATADLPPGILAGVLTSDIAAAAAVGDEGPPRWVKIAPCGEFTCRDGRTYTLDPKAVIARFQADGAHVPIDLGHETVRNNAAPALGWIDELETRSDGLYGRVDWLAGGKAVLVARTHRYVSPAFHHDAQNRATWLHSVALVAAPALARMPALAAAGAGLAPGTGGLALAPEVTATTLSAALGLPEGADEPARLAALHAGFVPVATHDRALALLSSTAEELRVERSERRTEKVNGLVEEALKAMKIVPAERDGYLALCSTDAGFATVERLFATMTAKTAPSVLESRSLRSSGGAATPQALAAQANRLIRERVEKGLPQIGIAEAMGRLISGNTDE